jgi:hypothetical protein
MMYMQRLAFGHFVKSLSIRLWGTIKARREGSRSTVRFFLVVRGVSG